MASMPTPMQMQTPVPMHARKSQPPIPFMGPSEVSAFHIAPPSGSDPLGVRAARLRAQLSREANPSVAAHLAGELAGVEEYLRMGYS